VSKQIRINSPDQLGAVHDLIHDCFFDLDDIVFDPPPGVLSFRFRRPLSNKKGLRLSDFISRSKDLPAQECFLRIHHVRSYSIDDKEKVGSYDFNVLDYNPKASCIFIRTGIPVDIRVAVSGFEVSVEETDDLFVPRQVAN